MKKNIGAVFFVFFSVITAFSENTVYELGPKIDDTIVFTAAHDKDNNETFSTQQLEKFADDLKNTKLPIRVIIAITDNDTPDLPKTVPVQTYKNTNRRIQNGSCVYFIGRQSRQGQNKCRGTQKNKPRMACSRHIRNTEKRKFKSGFSFKQYYSVQTGNHKRR